MSRRSVLTALLVLACVSGTGTTWAAFSSTTSNTGNVITAKRIFPTTETTTAWTVSDQADGSASNQTDAGIAAGDGRTFNTGTWSSSFSATRYIETVYATPLPNGLSISNLSYEFVYQATNAGDTVCFYMEVRRTSDGTVLGTHGSTGTPLRCATGTAVQTVSEPLPEITTSADANDLTVRVYARVSGNRPITIDRGTVNGTAGNGYGSFQLNEVHYVDRATGTAFQFPYGLATQDGTGILYSGWATTFSATRYLQWTYPSDFVPSGATITGVTFTNVFRNGTSGRSTCFYYEFRNGANLITSRGSSGTPYGCSDTANNWATHSISLPEVDTPAEVNGLFVRAFGRNSTGTSGTRHDLITIAVDYYLD